MRFGDYFLLRLAWGLVWRLAVLTLRIAVTLVLLPFPKVQHKPARHRYTPRAHQKRNPNGRW